MKITDILLLGPQELKILCDQYHNCEVNKLTDSEDLIQQYGVSIQAEDEESYYDFLLDNCIAMSSHNFYYRVKNDRMFSDRMKKGLLSQ